MAIPILNPLIHASIKFIILNPPINIMKKHINNGTSIIVNNFLRTLTIINHQRIF